MRRLQCRATRRGTGATSRPGREGASTPNGAQFADGGIPLRFRTRQFEHYLADTPDKQHALKVAQDFARQFSVHAKRGTFVVFSGRPGTGKSHLALAIAQHVMRNGTALYINTMDLIRRVRDTWRRDSEYSETQ